MAELTQISEKSLATFVIIKIDDFMLSWPSLLQERLVTNITVVHHLHNLLLVLLL